jgi:isopenicillin N synthase-like dioxygenase
MVKWKPVDNKENHLMTLDLNAIYHHLQQQFYVNVPFPMDRSVIEDAVQSFFSFLAEPDAIKEHLRFNIAPLHRRGEVGYFHRDPNEHIYNDSKDYFHYHPALTEKYADFITHNSVVNDFFSKAHPIWELAYQTAENVLQLFDREYPGLADRVFKAEYPHILLRFLRYNWQNSGKYLAKPHFDAGSFTLAIAESCAGLRIGSCPEDLKLVNHQPGNAIFMLSSNFKILMQRDDLAAGWHDVIQLDETQIGKPFARWAVVAFIEAANVEALPRSQTHKWYPQGDLEFQAPTK